MCKLFRLVLVGLGLVAWVVVAWAAEPPVPRTTGKVLLLESERALEGDIERHGDQYCIRRGSGELWVPADKGLCLCAGWDEAFARLAARANLADADERLRLARWCQAHGLRGRALAEVKAALEIRPGSAEAKKLLTSYQNTPVAQPGQPAAATASAPAAPPPAIDLSADCQALFSTRVQPILLNACAICHATGRGGDFQLVRWTEGGQRSAAQKNLAAVLPQINCERPSLSPLLVKAASVHGHGTQPPLPGGRQSVPFHTLENWLQLVLASNPHLRPPGRNPPAVFGPLPAAEAGQALAPPPELGPPSAAPPQLGPAASKAPPVVSRTIAAPPPSRAAPTAVVGADPFDPMIFNRQLHPQK